MNPLYNTEEESGIYEQLSVVTGTQSLNQASMYHQYRNPALMTKNSGGVYGSLPHQMGSGSLHGSSQSLQNIYANYHGNQNHIASGCTQQPFPFYMTRNSTMYSSLPTRKYKQGHVAMDIPSRSSPIYTDPKCIPGMREQWVDFVPSVSDKIQSSEYGHILSDKSNNFNKQTRNNQQMKTVGNDQQARSSTVIGGLLPMKTALPAIEEDLCDCSISESDNKTRSYKSCRSCRECGGITSLEDGNTDYLSVTNSDSLERITPLPDISQSLEVNLLLLDNTYKIISVYFCVYALAF